MSDIDILLTFLVVQAAFWLGVVTGALVTHGRRR